MSLYLRKRPTSAPMMQSLPPEFGDRDRNPNCEGMGLPFQGDKVMHSSQGQQNPINKRSDAIMQGTIMHDESDAIMNRFDAMTQQDNQFPAANLLQYSNSNSAVEKARMSSSTGMLGSDTLLNRRPSSGVPLTNGAGFLKHRSSDFSRPTSGDRPFLGNRPMSGKRTFTNNSIGVGKKVHKLTHPRKSGGGSFTMNSEGNNLVLQKDFHQTIPRKSPAEDMFEFSGPNSTMDNDYHNLEIVSFRSGITDRMSDTNSERANTPQNFDSGEKLDLNNSLKRKNDLDVESTTTTNANYSTDELDVSHSASARSSKNNSNNVSSSASASSDHERSSKETSRGNDDSARRSKKSGAWGYGNTSVSARPVASSSNSTKFEDYLRKKGMLVGDTASNDAGDHLVLQPQGSEQNDDDLLELQRKKVAAQQAIERRNASKGMKDLGKIEPIDTSDPTQDYLSRNIDRMIDRALSLGGDLEKLEVPIRDVDITLAPAITSNNLIGKDLAVKQNVASVGGSSKNGSVRSNQSCSTRKRGGVNQLSSALEPFSTPFSVRDLFVNDVGTVSSHGTGKKSTNGLTDSQNDALMTEQDILRRVELTLQKEVNRQLELMDLEERGLTQPLPLTDQNDGQEADQNASFRNDTDAVREPFLAWMPSMPDSQQAIMDVDELLRDHEKKNTNTRKELEEYVLSLQDSLPDSFQDAVDVAAEMRSNKRAIGAAEVKAGVNKGGDTDIPTFVTGLLLEEDDDDWEAQRGKVPKLPGDENEDDVQREKIPRIEFHSANYTEEECLKIEKGLNQIARLDSLLAQCELRAKRIETKSGLEIERIKEEMSISKGEAEQEKNEMLQILVQKGLLTKNQVPSERGSERSVRRKSQEKSSQDKSQDSKRKNGNANSLNAKALSAMNSQQSGMENSGMNSSSHLEDDSQVGIYEDLDGSSVAGRSDFTSQNGNPSWNGNSLNSNMDTDTSNVQAAMVDTSNVQDSMDTSNVQDAMVDTLNAIPWDSWSTTKGQTKQQVKDQLNAQQQNLNQNNFEDIQSSHTGSNTGSNTLHGSVAGRSGNSTTATSATGSSGQIAGKAKGAGKQPKNLRFSRGDPKKTANIVGFKGSSSHPPDGKGTDNADKSSSTGSATAIVKKGTIRITDDDNAFLDDMLGDVFEKPRTKSTNYKGEDDDDQFSSTFLTIVRSSDNHTSSSDRGADSRRQLTEGILENLTDGSRPSSGGRSRSNGDIGKKRLLQLASNVADDQASTTSNRESGSELAKIDEDEEEAEDDKKADDEEFKLEIPALENPYADASNALQDIDKKLLAIEEGPNGGKRNVMTHTGFVEPDIPRIGMLEYPARNLKTPEPPNGEYLDFSGNSKKKVNAMNGNSFFENSLFEESSKSVLDIDQELKKLREGKTNIKIDDHVVKRLIETNGGKVRSDQLQKDPFGYGEGFGEEEGAADGGGNTSGNNLVNFTSISGQISGGNNTPTDPSVRSFLTTNGMERKSSRPDMPALGKIDLQKSSSMDVTALREAEQQKEIKASFSVLRRMQKEFECEARDLDRMENEIEDTVYGRKNGFLPPPTNGKNARFVFANNTTTSSSSSTSLGGGSTQNTSRRGNGVATGISQSRRNSDATGTGNTKGTGTTTSKGGNRRGDSRRATTSSLSSGDQQSDMGQEKKSSPTTFQGLNLSNIDNIDNLIIDNINDINDMKEIMSLGFDDETSALLKFTQKSQASTMDKCDLIMKDLKKYMKSSDSTLYRLHKSAKRMLKDCSGGRNGMPIRDDQPDSETRARLEIAVNKHAKLVEKTRSHNNSTRNRKSRRDVVSQQHGGTIGTSVVDDSYLGGSVVDDSYLGEDSSYREDDITVISEGGGTTLSSTMGGVGILSEGSKRRNDINKRHRQQTTSSKGAGTTIGKEAGRKASTISPPNAPPNMKIGKVENRDHGPKPVRRSREEAMREYALKEGKGGNGKTIDRNSKSNEAFQKPGGSRTNSKEPTRRRSGVEEPNHTIDRKVSFDSTMLDTDNDSDEDDDFDLDREFREKRLSSLLAKDGLDRSLEDKNLDALLKDLDNLDGLQDPTVKYDEDNDNKTNSMFEGLIASGIQRERLSQLSQRERLLQNPISIIPTSLINVDKEIAKTAEYLESEKNGRIDLQLDGDEEWKLMEDYDKWRKMDAETFIKHVESQNQGKISDILPDEEIERMLRKYKI